MTDLEVYPDTDRTPSTLFASPDPAAIVAQATRIANTIAPLIREQRLVKRIGQSDHVFLEGWTLAGTMLGVFPITVSSRPLIDPEGIEAGYEATVEARTMAGNLVGRADAQCTHDENAKWRDAPSFQLRSMAITRASSKALRMPLGFVMHLAGYDATPAEEMEAAAARGETVSGGRGVAAGWRDLAEQETAHRRMRAFLDEHGVRELADQIADSKGYSLPLSKPQMADLRRAIDRELAETSDPPPSATPPVEGARADPTSPAPVRGSQEPEASTSGVGLSAGDQPDGASGDGSPSAGSPTPDPKHSRPVLCDTCGSTSHTTAWHDKYRPDETSPPDPAGAQKAAAAERGDAKVGPAESGSLAGEGSPEGGNGGSAGPAYPVEEWAIRQDPPVDLRVAKVALRKQFRTDFGWLRDWRDLAELQGEQAVNAIKAMEAIYLDPGEGKP